MSRRLDPVLDPLAAAAERAWRFSCARYRALQGLLALGVYLAGWLLTEVRPLIEHPSRVQLDQYSMDPSLFIWCLRWWPYAISHGFNPLYTSQIGVPVGHALSWVTTIPPLALLAAPLTEAAGPVFAFNVLAAISLPLAAWTAFIMCRRLTNRFWPSLVGGLVYGFSAFEMNHIVAGQLDLTFSLLLPVMVYLAVLWRDGAISSRIFVILLALTMTAQFYQFLETFAGLSGVLLIGLLVGYALAGRADRPRVAQLSRLVGLAYAVTLVLAAPYLYAALAHMPPKFTHITSLDLASLIVPRPGRTLGMGWLTHLANGPVPQSAEGYVGIPLLLIALALAVAGWSSKLIRFLSVMLVIVILASLGPVVYFSGNRLFSLPWARAWGWPILQSAFPSRLMAFAFLMLAIITALWLAGPAKRLWARWPLALLAVAAIVLDTPAMSIAPRSDVPTFISAGWYRHDLKQGETMLVISNFGNAGMLWQAESNFYMRLAGGYVSQMLTPRTDLPLAVQNLDFATPLYVEQFRAFVMRANIGVILVDANAAPRWIGIFSKLGLQGQLDGGVLVYHVDGCRTCHLVLLAAGRQASARYRSPDPGQSDVAAASQRHAVGRRIQKSGVVGLRPVPVGVRQPAIRAGNGGPGSAGQQGATR